MATTEPAGISQTISAAPVLGASALILLAVAAQWALHDRMLVPMDEGHLAAAAGWMLEGKRLYRDIHTGIFPGIYLITTLLFGVFGRDMLVMRLAAVAMNAAIALSLWLIARRMLRPHWACLPPLLHACLVVVSFPVLSMFNYSTLAVCFGLAALLFLLRYLERGRRLDAVLLGLFVALCTLTKQNFGLLVFVSLLAGLLWCRARSALALCPLSSTLLPIALSGAAITALVVSWFLLTGTLGDLIESTILSLGSSQAKDFNNPLPPILGSHPGDGRFIFLYSPPTLFAYLVRGESMLGLELTPLVRSLAIRLSYALPLLVLCVSPLVLWRRASGADPAEQRAARVCVLFALLFFPGIFPSAIWSHLAFVLIPILLLAGLLADQLETWLAARPRAGARLVLSWRLCALAGVLLAASAAARISADIVRWHATPLGLERASLQVSEREAGLFRGAHRFVESCAGASEPIFVAPDIPAVWFLTGRPNPTRYDLTIPGNVDGALIARRLEESGTRCIVFNPQMYPEFPPFARLFPVLHRYIETHFRGEAVITGGETKWLGLVRRSE